MQYFEEIPVDELYHHGILGQKWGIRRYQNKDGSLTPLGKKHWEMLDEDTVEKEKSRIVKSGDLGELQKHRDQFDSNQVNEAINNFNLNKKLSELYSTDEYKKGQEAFKKVVDNTKNISDLLNNTANIVSNGTTMYNNIAKVVNAFSDADLPLVNDKKEKKAKTYSLESLKKQGTSGLTAEEVKERKEWASNATELEKLLNPEEKKAPKKYTLESIKKQGADNLTAEEIKERKEYVSNANELKKLLNPEEKKSDSSNKNSDKKSGGNQSQKTESQITNTITNTTNNTNNESKNFTLNLFSNNSKNISVSSIKTETVDSGKDWYASWDIEDYEAYNKRKGRR